MSIGFGIGSEEVLGDQPALSGAQMRAGLPHDRASVPQALGAGRVPQGLFQTDGPMSDL